MGLSPPAPHPPGRELPTRRLVHYLNQRTAGGVSLSRIARELKLKQHALAKVWKGTTHNASAKTLQHVSRYGGLSADFFLDPGPEELRYQDFLRRGQKEPPHEAWRLFLRDHGERPHFDEYIIETLRRVDFVGLEPTQRTYWKLGYALDDCERPTDTLPDRRRHTL